MAKIKLLDKVLAASNLSLEFSSLSTQRTAQGELIAVLQLSAPLESVRGSQEIVFNGQRIGLVAKDVTEVKVHQNDFDGIEWDDVSDTGSYNGSKLALDVSKGLQVWMVSRSFAAAGNEMRRNNQNGRLAELVKNMGVKVEDAPVEKAVNPGVLEPVDTAAGGKKGK